MSVTPDRFERVVDSLERLTERLASAASDMRVLAERQAAAAEVTSNVRHDIDTLRRLLDEERKARLAVASDLSMWVNRGWGAWGLLTLIFVLFTTMDWHRRPDPPLYHYTPPRGGEPHGKEAYPNAPVGQR
jgi:hypothetical protein